MRAERIEVVEAARVGRDVPRPYGLEYTQLLVGGAAAMRVYLGGLSEGRKFLAHPTHSDSQVNATPGQVVQRGDHLCREQRVAVRQDQHRDAESHTLRLARQVAERPQRLEVRLGR
jgi:hypothetical protein